MILPSAKKGKYRVFVRDALTPTANGLRLSVHPEPIGATGHLGINSFGDLDPFPKSTRILVRGDLWYLRKRGYPPPRVLAVVGVAGQLSGDSLGATLLPIFQGEPLFDLHAPA